MKINRPRLIENDRALPAAIGYAENRATDANRECAAKAIGGFVAFYSTTWTQVGRCGIDWSGKHHNHVEWKSQLNRFFQLSALAAIYAETRDEQYAEAARVTAFAEGGQAVKSEPKGPWG